VVKNDRTRQQAKRGPSAEQLSDHHFEAILNSISDGVFAVDGEWRITCFNRAAERTIGIRRADALGRRCNEVFRSNICREACALRYTIETGNPIVNLPITIRNAAEQRVPVSVSTAVLRDQEGRVIGGVESFRDLNLVKKFLEDVEATTGGPQILTADLRMKKLLRLLPTIAQSDSTVLIEGESGTGKGLLARAIHAASPRRDGPFMTVNCGALPESLLESELFGYHRGAFTGADRDKPGRFQGAEGGTLFLDEIGDLPLSVQVKLLRFLQDKVYEPLGGVESRSADVRLVTATNRHLSQCVDKGEFRADLYYRINVIRLEMPPLRERPADIPLLADAILRRLSISRGKLVEGISREVLRRLESYAFPGNIRELENIIEHAYVLCTGPRLEEHDLPDWLPPSPLGRPDGDVAPLEELEARYIRDALAAHRWNRADTARALGVHKTTLYRKIRKLHIDLPSGSDGRTARTAATHTAKPGKQ
jgi:PAS domain S-box-containing protein